MPSYKKLPSGKWQAAVSLPQRTPSGNQRRITKSHKLKGVVRDWAIKLESEIAAGQWSDPRSADLVLSDWYEQWCAGRMVAGSSQRRDDSHWRVHIEPKWGGYPLNTLSKQEIRRWVKELHEDQVGIPTIRGVLTTMSAMLHAAVEEVGLQANPLAGTKLPRQDPKPIFWWTHEEVAELVTSVSGQGHNPLMVGLDFKTGLRLGELLGLKCKYIHDLGDRLAISVAGVQTRDGWREYPKSVMSRRVVPVPPEYTEPLGKYIAGMGPEDIVFPAPRGTAWDDRNWARRVFEPAIKSSGVRRGTPHDMRHTAASHLVQAGVDLYVVQALLGHESFRTTQRYAHLAPDSFDKVINAWNGMGGEQT